MPALPRSKAKPIVDDTVALESAVGIHEKPTLSADLDAVPDAIFFMTDGTPSNGDITQTNAILSLIHDFNRFAKKAS